MCNRRKIIVDGWVVERGEKYLKTYGKKIKQLN